MITSILLSQSWAQAHTSINYKNIEVATSVEQAHTLRNLREDAILDYYLGMEIGEFNGPRRHFFTGPLLARILKNVHPDQVNEAILRQSTRATQVVGTKFPGILGLGKVVGDYDFKLLDLIPITYEGIRRNVFNRRALDKLFQDLLIVKGDQKDLRNTFLGVINVHETENHILMIESARYLTNQLLHKKFPQEAKYNNDLNGLSEWFLKHLQQFAKRDFEEYNSRPYQGYTIRALLNLIAYAEDERVKLAATMLMDYLSAKFATQTSRLRRFPPICRQKRYAHQNNLIAADQLASMFFTISGNHEALHSLPYPIATLMVMVSKYMPNDLILDLIINRDQILQQRYSHHGVESYFKHPKYLISAGGKFLNHFDGGLGKLDGWAAPISVLPHDNLTNDLRDLVRIEGHKKPERRNNMCHYKNFACGLNIKLPQSLPKNCLKQKGNWSFIDFASAGCPSYGVYIIVHRKRYVSVDWMRESFAEDYGFIEVVDSAQTSLENLVYSTLYFNSHSFHPYGKNVYKSFSGDVIEFFPANTDLDVYPIGKVNGKIVAPKKFNHWKFLSGDVLNNDGGGVIKISNPKLGEVLTLDFRRPLNPVKMINRN